MNIFEALSNGKGSINEENVSSFLAYLMKDNESHGLRREFMKRFLKLIALQEIDLEYFDVSIELEKRSEACNGKSKNRNIDICVFLKERDDEEKKSPKGKNENKGYIIAIENKIKPSSCQDKQLAEQYLNLTKNHKDKKVCMVFLVPDIEKKGAKSEFNELEKVFNSLKDKRDDKKCFIQWKDIIKTIDEMIIAEQKMEISPLSDYLKQTLKAFCYYINSLVVSRLPKEKMNKVKVIYDRGNGKEEYYLIRLPDGSMRIDCENREGLMPKHMIFDVLFELGVYSKKDAPVGPRWGKYIVGLPSDLGREMFNRLREKGLNEVKITDKEPCFSPENRRANSNIF